MKKKDNKSAICLKNSTKISYISLLGNPPKKVIKVLFAIIVYIIIFIMLMIVSSIIFKSFLDIFVHEGNFSQIETLGDLMDSSYFEKLSDWFLFLLVPTSIFTYRLVYKASHKVLISVNCKFRWKWIKKCLKVLVPLMGFVVIGQTLLDGIPPVMLSLKIALSILLTFFLTPLQSAGEEYLFRGCCLQVFATVIKSEKWAWIIFSIVSSIIFSIIHFPDDIYVATDLFVFGLLMCGLIYFTGGIEASIIFHTLNNLFLNIITDLTSGALTFEVDNIIDGPFIEGTVVSIISNILICGLIVWMWKNYEKAVNPNENSTTS